jgi:hypothetical protein
MYERLLRPLFGAVARFNPTFLMPVAQALPSSLPGNTFPNGSALRQRIIGFVKAPLWSAIAASGKLPRTVADTSGVLSLEEALRQFTGPLAVFPEVRTCLSSSLISLGLTRIYQATTSNNRGLLRVADFPSNGGGGKATKVGVYVVSFKYVGN